MSVNWILFRRKYSNYKFIPIIFPHSSQCHSLSKSHDNLTFVRLHEIFTHTDILFQIFIDKSDNINCRHLLMCLKFI